MTLALDGVLGSLALFGHVALWVALFNRAHAMPWHCKLVKLAEKTTVLICWAIMGWFCYANASRLQWPLLLTSTSPLSIAWQIYLWICVVQGIRILALWLRWRLSPKSPQALVSQTCETFDLGSRFNERPIGKWKTGVLASIPGNEILKLEVNRKELQVRRLSSALDGLTITHFSDIHLTGQITQNFYDEVVAEANKLQSDVIMLTGDIVDKQECIEWVPQTFGELQAKQGVYAILGNHDKRICDVQLVRDALATANIIDVGGTWQWIELRGQRVLLAGNERPWFPWHAEEQLPPISPDEFRILMSHTPDEIEWARERGFDLMLAGHNHGGQVRFPVVGPIATPSWYGVRYACGLFDEAPTLLHVSRGIAAVHPIRYWCSPELTQITLRCEPGRRGN